MAGTCNADEVALDLLTSLTAGKDFNIEEPDLSGPEFDIPPVTDNPLFQDLTRLTNEDLTTREPKGSGTFDALMESAKLHIREEYEKNRITGSDFTKAYIALTEAALGNAVQFLLGKDQAYWTAVTAQLQARQAEVAVVIARVQLEIEKVRLKATIFEARNQEATYALTMMKLSTESAAYCTAEYNLENLLPKQGLLLDEQVKLTKEQYEAARAQTMDTRSDGPPVLGAMGKQKDLYNQQITSYQRDAEVKAGKLFTDAWITMKTIDEGITPPSGFTNVSIDTVLTKLKTENGFI